MPAIVRVHAREILDSRGTPTVEVEVTLADGTMGRAAVPSGASTGRHEAVELRDGDPARYRGRGVRRAVQAVRDTLGPGVAGLDAADQRGVDARLCALDGTPQKSRCGANAVLGVSLAAAHAAAAAARLPLFRHLGRLAGDPAPTTLPVPLANVFNGGAHADNGVDVQEFMLVPIGAGSFAEGLRWVVECASALKALCKARGLNTAVGDEGGVAPVVTGGARAVCELLLRAIADAGLAPGVHVALALDAAASGFARDGGYVLAGEGGRRFDAGGLVEFWAALADAYPIVSLEDGLAEDDWEGWRALTARLGGRLQIVGDDLFVTDPARLRRGIESGAANAVLVKPNQIGTLAETLDTIAAARAAGYAAIVSHRSGETCDATLADLAVATGVGQVKTGAPVRGERTAKYNQLLRIEEALGADAVYGRPGRRAGTRAPG